MSVKRALQLMAHGHVDLVGGFGFPLSKQCKEKWAPVGDARYIWTAELKRKNEAVAPDLKIRQCLNIKISEIPNLHEHLPYIRAQTWLVR